MYNSFKYPLAWPTFRNYITLKILGSLTAQSKSSIPSSDLRNWNGIRNNMSDNM